MITPVIVKPTVGGGTVYNIRIVKLPGEETYVPICDSKARPVRLAILSIIDYPDSPEAVLSQVNQLPKLYPDLFASINQEPTS